MGMKLKDYYYLDDLIPRGVLHKVTLWEHKEDYKSWCKKNTPSFVKHECLDYSDTNSAPTAGDWSDDYYFKDESDAVLFALKWK